MSAENSTYTIALIPGDGIGPEIISVAVEVLKQATAADGVSLNFIEYEAGAAAYQKYGDAMPSESLAGCKEADAIFKGPTGAAECSLARWHRSGGLGWASA